MAVGRYVSHPEVIVESDVAVDRWQLSERGVERLDRLLELPWVPAIGRIVCRHEPKAQQTAEALAAHRGLAVETRSGLGEIDRSATGFLPPDEHDAVADACFAQPAVSARGWEPAIDAQPRIINALADLFDEEHTDVAIAPPAALLATVRGRRRGVARLSSRAGRVVAACVGAT